MSDKVFPYLEGLLDLTARRQQALMSNIANIDTPGYKARDVAFKTEMGKAVSSTRVVLRDSPDKENGNNVNLEQEMTEMTKNGLQYVTLVQYLNQKMKTLRSSIMDGGRI